MHSLRVPMTFIAAPDFRQTIKKMTTTATEFIHIEVVYATPDVQPVVTLEIESGSTVKDAICQSGLLERFPGIDLDNTNVGIFGKSCTLDQCLADRDRVEIYRPLIADPKEIRRKRAAEGKKMKKGG